MSGRRYVFWRRPDGKPDKGVDSKHAPCAVLSQLGKSAFINQDGRVSWDFFTFELDTAIDSTLAVIGPDGRELNDVDASAIRHKAIGSVIKHIGGRKPIAPSDLIKEADRAAATYFRQKTTPYLLVTALSTKSFPVRRILVNGHEVRPLRARGSRYPFPKHLLRFASGGFAEHIRSTCYQTVLVTTSGRTINEASSKGLAALDLLRALWTLFATYGSWTRHFLATRQYPVGVIHGGPIHTLHSLKGSLAKDVYWYDPGFVADHEVFEPKKGWAKVERGRRWALGRMRHLPYRGDLEQILLRYIGALDNSDLDVAFLQLWGILEKLTDTVGGNYDETVNRAAWIYKDRSVAKQMLEALRCRRNLYVHAATSGQDRDSVALSLKAIIDPHLLRLIRNDFQVQSVAEHGYFLSMPTDPSTLKKRKKQYAMALRFKGE